MARWAVQAEGEAPEGLHDEIADRLGKLLGLVKYGTDASNFAGAGHNGPVHEKAPADDTDDLKGNGDG